MIAMRRVILASVALACLTAAAHAALRQELDDELRRQERAVEDLAATVERVGTLLEDLRLNGLAKSKHGEELLWLARSLDAVRDEEIASARQHLAAALKATADPREQLTAAATEVETAVEKLTEILRRVSVLRMEELILMHLRQAVDRLELVIPATQEAQRLQLAGAGEFPERVTALVDAQGRVNDRAVQVRQLLDTAVEQVEPQDKPRFQRAAQFMDEVRVRENLGVALANLHQQDLLGAAVRQAAALEGLQALEKLLLEDVDLLELLKDARKKLLKILEDEIALREETEQTPDEAFDARKNALYGAQRGIRNELSEVDANLLAPDASLGAAVPTGSPGNPILLAGDAMERAEGSLSAGERPPAVTAEKQAEEHLREAIRQLDRKIAMVEQGLTDPELAKRIADLKELIERIRELEAKQRGLRETTETRLAAEQSVQGLAGGQSALAGETDEVAQLPAAVENLTIQAPLQDASGFMRNASTSLNEREGPKAVPLQVDAEQALRKARDAAEALLAQLEQQAQMQDQLTAAKQALEQLQNVKAEQVKLHEQTQAAAQQSQPVEPFAQPQGALPAKLDQIPSTSRTPEMNSAMQQASQAMQQASQNLAQNQPPPAMANQEQALSALDQAIEAAQQQVDALQQMQDIMDAMAAAADLAAQQQQLMQQTQAAQSPSQMQPLAQPQANLGQQSQAMSPNPIAGPQFQQAGQHMQAAAQQLEQGNQPGALAEQMQALQSLGQAQQMAQSAMGMEPGQQPGMGMQPGMMGMGMAPGMMGMGIAPGMMGMGMSMVPSEMTALAMDSFMPGDPQGGDRLFVKQAGQLSQSLGRERRRTLGPREREALQQHFAEGLPVEYRQMLREYFESISE
jgi:DNA repair exonuclease SbcCD ATPase subunit